MLRRPARAVPSAELRPNFAHIYRPTHCLAVLTEAEPVARVLAHLGLPTEAPSVARARDPTDDGDESEPGGQLELGLA
jgi:hypothetical protein